MTIERTEIEKLVSMCWDVACTTPMDGVPAGMFIAGIVDVSGQPAIHTVRWTTYGMLLNNLLPKHNSFDAPKQPKEPWEE